MGDLKVINNIDFNNLTVLEKDMENSFVNVMVNENGDKFVSYKELHTYCEIKTHHSTFFKRNVEELFEEGLDYHVFTNEMVGTRDNGSGKAIEVDYILTMDTAKHVGMMSKTNKGKQIRNYFVACEKQVYKPVLTVEQRKKELAYRLLIGGIDSVQAHKELIEIETQPLIDKIEIQKPKVDLADKRLSKDGCISLTDATKTFELKKGRITRWAKENGYIHKKITEVNKNGEKYFKIYYNGDYKSIGITEEGMNFIKENIEKIK